MVLVLKIRSCICATEIFTINGVVATYKDFGDKYDRGEESYGCDDMQFTGKECTHEILDKYSITQCEYDYIVSELSKKLSFGSCCLCI